ncbi:uncharacterized protein LOC130591687 [Beta vulgaris subsp. vulgaris]|uniref:uncharacterized protein LOC130591687 n=1 Tax=Beta vulgaris subsp. vulgaris TaxID=3555 RepID=UPI00254673C8|nr:uncharacterized protein LOC130591687 [Beta vulgaris subsp. vulgaris]
MSGRKQASFGSGCSSNSRRVKCKCGNNAVVRTVKNGPNVGSRFYGCPLWPDTKCEMFKIIDDSTAHEDLQFQIFEKDTSIAELEVVQTFKDNKIMKLQTKKHSLELEISALKKENAQLRCNLVQSATNEKNLKFALIVLCLLFCIFYYLK